ncbi:hypothetical protein [Lentzea atacamensis]|uniref:hypothetical protein n=1 Tax=Lentzea atacamensis TaxID=531938 RepID=UPI002D7903F1|nr:hypothetical protein [Lentzea atacamensis]
MTNGWTGADARMLQDALRLSQEAFAEYLDVHPRTVGYWHQKPSSRPKSEIQQMLDTALDRAPADVQARFAELRGTGTSPTATEPAPVMAATEAEQRLASDPNIVAALDWLDERGTREPGTARRAVASRLVEVDVNSLQDRGSRRGRVDQSKVAQALADYYGRGSDGYGRYAARFGDVEADTSVFTRSDWLDLDCPLIATHDRLKLMRAAGAAPVSLDEEAFDQAAQRLAESLALGIRFVNMPLYRLLGVDMRKESLGGTVGISSFV